MNPDKRTIEQHLTVMYLLDVAQGEGISTVDVDGLSDLPDGAALLRLTQTDDSGERAQLAYEIARDGSHRQLSPQERSIGLTPPEKVWRGQDVESFAGVWYPFTTPTDPDWLELRHQLGRDPSRSPLGARSDTRRGCTEPRARERVRGAAARR